ncbi:flagellar hook-associated protein FlgL [Oleidesulfovibrio alaskensis]|uniref:flagellar hook-associated protein FlgL n=1 Tax=Oleidesulfovibrio alaskensis TaxID=58180 RepID=UPI001A3891FD|nr:flagellar hook-associated protein FlgL [Oleidesulfovibrio alaskensis]MBL3581531.1 flagellar hook-associated protein FlgL [Oleidesulfovibrio alaskensis]
MRVSQRSLFDNFISNMNMSLSNLMDSNIQASSQKRINKPSDDPVGAARVMGYRDSLAAIKQYRSNVDTATSWLATADQTLTQVNTVLTRIKGLAEQAATGTLDANNREQISFELRQQYEQLINLANTRVEGRHIFAGHKTDQPAFVQGLNVSTIDTAFSGASFSVSGSLEKTMLIQFTSNGQVGTDALSYRYSNDGGDTWQTGTLSAGGTTLTAGSVQVELPAGRTVSAVNPDNPHETDNGTWLYVRPTAVYKGDDNDSTTVQSYGNNLVNASGNGYFKSDVMVRIDSGTDLASGITYSYSTDNGSTWVEGNTTSGTGSSASLLIPGGFLELSSGAGSAVNPGDQFILRPHRADIQLEISPGEHLTINSVGKDIFGGIYNPPDGSGPQVAMGGGTNNLFEVVGELVAFAETNNQAGIQRSLAALDDVGQHVMTQVASIGGRENRLDVAKNVLTTAELDDKSRMSDIEDVDVAELMTRLAQQQLIYNSVLKSSSMIMQMNLTNYL